MWAYFRKRDLLWMIVKSIFTREKRKKYMSTKPTKVYTEAEVNALTNVQGGSLEHDNYGQLVIYTGIFQWKDQTFRSTPDPKYDEEG